MQDQLPDWLYKEPLHSRVIPRSALPSSARKVAPQRPTSRMGEPWSAPGASSAGAASAGVRPLDDACWRDSRAMPKIATSTAHDNDFAAAVTLEDLEEAKHDPFEWLQSPIKLTPLETSHRLAGTTHAEQKYTRDFDYIEQRDNVDGRRAKYIHSSRKQGGAEDSRKPAYNPGTRTNLFFGARSKSQYSVEVRLPVKCHLLVWRAISRPTRQWSRYRGGGTQFPKAALLAERKKEGEGLHLGRGNRPTTPQEDEVREIRQRAATWQRYVGARHRRKLCRGCLTSRHSLEPLEKQRLS